MRKLFITLILLNLVIFSVDLKADVKSITTKSQFKRLASQGPMLLFLSLSCSMGSSAVKEFNENFKDFSGVTLASTNINSLYNILNTQLKTGLGAILVIVNGNVVASTAQTSLLGLNNKRKWIAKKLRENGANFRYQELDFGRANPLNDSSSVNLNNGLIALYRFNGNTNDESGNNNRFQLSSKSRITNNVLTSDGYVYDGVHSPTAWIPKLHSKKPYTISVNFKQRKIEKSKYYNWSIIYEVKYRYFTVAVYKGKLTIYFETCWKENNKYTTYGEFYILDDTNLPYNQWHNLILGFNPDNRRIAVMVNGKRLKDVVFSSKIYKYFKEKNLFCTRERGINFHRGGAPGGFYGQADNLVVYNRLLNSSEMAALYNRYGNNTTNANDESQQNPNNSSNSSNTNNTNERPSENIDGKD